MFQDRPYQTEAVDSIWNYFREHTGNPVVAMPTGTGKSVVIARFLQSIYKNYPRQKVMILTHVKELIRQNYEKLMSAWAFAPAGVYSAGLNSRDHSQPIIFGGIASVAKKWALFGHVDLVIIDEAHLVSPHEATMYQAFLEGLRSINPFVKVIGLTATPWRLGHGRIIDPVVVKGKMLTPIFTDFCFDITGLAAFNRLIDEGYLIPLIPKRTKTELNTDGVHMRGGEFIESELQAAVNKSDVTEAALRETMELGADRNKWLIFASGTEHADEINTMLNLMGVPCVAVHSHAQGRDKAISAFRNGQVRAIVNNNMLTTGFDDPGIDLIVSLRPTMSGPLWVQMLGRGTRPLFMPGFDLNTIEGRLQSIAASAKQNCLVLDYARNTKRLGPINDPVVPKQRGGGTGEAPVRECELCGTYNHASVRKCIGCGYEFPLEVKIKAEASEDTILKGDLPVVEMFKVDYLTYDRHEKDNAPPMVRVTYYCGYKHYTEYVCVEHDKYALRKAQQWWRLRAPEMEMPTNTELALAWFPDLPTPTHIKVWTNKKYPEIMSVCFDGSGFGQWPVGTVAAPKADNVARDKTAVGWTPDLDDEIPF